MIGVVLTDPKPLKYVAPTVEEGDLRTEPQPVAIYGLESGGDQFTPAATTIAGFDGDGAPKTYPRGTITTDLLAADDAEAVRTLIGAGMSNLALGTTATTAKAGNYAPSTTEVSNGLKAKTQIAALEAVDTADATDATTAATLANANKAAINAVIAALKA